MQTERRDRVGRGKLPSRRDRLYDFETMSTQSMLSSNAPSPMPGAGATASLKTISGSIRGSRDPRAGTYRRSRRGCAPCDRKHIPRPVRIRCIRPKSCDW